MNKNVNIILTAEVIDKMRGMLLSQKGYVTVAKKF